MQRKSNQKPSNLLTAVLCLVITGCMSNNAVTEMRYPQIESSAVTVRHYVPRLISSDDYGSDMISPRRERVVRYRSPMPETIISRDNDMEQTKQFWNISIIEDDEDEQFIIHNAQFTMKNEKSADNTTSTEAERSDAIHNAQFTMKNEKSADNVTSTETEKSKNNEQLAMSNEASFPLSKVERGTGGEVLAKSEHSAKAEPAKKETIKKEPIKKETAFVPVRKIDEDSLDMTNLKNLKVKEMPQQEQAGVTDSQLTLSMAGDQWVMKKMLPAYLELKDRKSTDKQTIFTFDVKAPGEVNLVFVRTTKNEIVRQPYKIFIQESPSKNTKPTSDTAAKPGAAEASYKAGMAAKRQAKNDEARKHFTAALSDPDNAYYADALTELIGLYKNDNDTAGAAKAYNQYATPDARQSDDKLGILDYDLLVMNGDYKGAITGYRKFMQDFPESNLTDKALYYLAYSLEHYKVNPDYREAYRIYNIIISRYPESKYHKPSQNRSLYLERHYLKIN
ncbi:MAG: tetratricopeptide repeat protein [Spirochaetales bacterium]|nr:tetratricopeptide repeat protein [Spirochaetales bacterium]